MGSSRTGLDLEDTWRTKFCGLGLGLGLDHGVLEHIVANNIK